MHETGNKGTAVTAPGTLYIVATPLGNLDDMVPRAVTVLQTVDRVAAEDTRRTRALLTHFGVRVPLTAYHEHSAPEKREALLADLSEGRSLALVSDAGTPLIADPGYRLVREATARGVPVVPVPGACAVTAALSAAGLPTDRFAFEGFLPAKTSQRERVLQALAEEPRTLVFYETARRLVGTLSVLSRVMGESREAVIARELTKRYETFYRGTLGELARRAVDDGNLGRGEIVLMVRGHDDREPSLDARARETARVLADALPPSQAAELAARLTGVSRRVLYAWLQSRKNA